MTEQQAQTEIHNPVENPGEPVVDQANPAEKPKKKKASWLRTILWMVAMMLIANVLMLILAYFLYRYKII